MRVIDPSVGEWPGPWLRREQALALLSCSELKAVQSLGCDAPTLGGRKGLAPGVGGVGGVGAVEGVGGG